MRTHRTGAPGRPRSRMVLPVMAVVVAGLVLSGCSSGDEDGGSGGSNEASTQYVAGTGEITALPVAERQQAPDISGTTLDGEEIALSDYRGEIVVLNVWGSWCGPCRTEAPHLQAVHEATQDRGVRFLGINTRDLDEVPARRFEETNGITYPSIYDPAGRLVLEFKGNLMPQAIPSTLIIDREGRIAVRALKALTEQELTDMIEPMLAEDA
ncbi:TlpA family protein disulfide reductase [Allostreptomyces psammosilenae]|uniref:Peroxiredoxin n=1 Tax=Allostreptomyces psammosilenae TaxID=1892865 RepID=A0A853A508_9ACTN|nr:TlpA disulfide reductase family protein [Allostreptomyces psammosilenae]NYI05781.1 peroxiredoxin [Allostreptomyces psammosilenae]